MEYKTNCQRCGKEVVGKKRPRKYCSKQCHDIAQTKYFPIPCENCGKEFTPEKNKIKYCSLACNGEAQHKKTLTATCAVCGDKYNPGYRKAKFCSMECFRIDQKDRINSRLKKCPGCGEDFLDYPSQPREHCSHACRSKVIENLHKKQCKNCNNEFIARDDNDYCSFNCFKDFKSKEREAICLNCGNVFIKNRLNREQKTCSHSCHNSYKFNPENPNCIEIPKGYGRCKTGFYTSTKTNKLYFFRSSWEEIYMKWLDYDDDVLYWEYEPIVLSYVDESGYKTSYRPDFYIVFQDYSRDLVEVKPSCFLENEDVILEAKCGIEFAKTNGFYYRFVCNKEIYHLNKLLSQEVA